MSTSGTGAIFQVCFVALIAAAVLAAGTVLRSRPSPRDVSAAGRILWLVVAVPSLVQIAVPSLYDVLGRNAAAILDGRQWWRVATAMVVQDGGIAGTISNLVLLAVALLLCCPLWGAPATATTFLLAGVGLNISAVLVGAADGAGNSGATMPLLASLPPCALAIVGPRPRPVAALAITLAAAVILIVVRDGHGYAIALGLLIGTVGKPFARARLRRGLIMPSPAARGTPEN